MLHIPKHIQKNHFIFLSFIASCSALRNANNVMEDPPRTIKNNSTVTAIENCDNETAYLRAIVDDDQEKAEKIRQGNPGLVDRIRANPDKYCTDRLRDEIIKISQEGDSNLSDRLFKIMYPSYKQDMIFTPKNIESRDKQNFSSKFLRSLFILRVRSYLKKDESHLKEVLTTILPNFIFDLTNNKDSGNSESYALPILFQEIDWYCEENKLINDGLDAYVYRIIRSNTLNEPNDNPSQSNDNPSQSNDNPSQSNDNPSQSNDNPSQLFYTLCRSIEIDLESYKLKDYEVKILDNINHLYLFNRLKFKILGYLVFKGYLTQFTTIVDQIAPSIHKNPSYYAAAICSFLNKVASHNNSDSFDRVLSIIQPYLQANSSLYVHDILYVVLGALNNNDINKAKTAFNLIKSHVYKDQPVCLQKIMYILLKSVNYNDSDFFDTVLSQIETDLKKNLSLYDNDIFNILKNIVKNNNLDRCKRVKNNNLDRCKRVKKCIEFYFNNNSNHKKYQYKLDELFVLAKRKKNKDMIDLLKPFYICQILPKKYEKEECSICLEPLGATEDGRNRKQIVEFTCTHRFDNRCFQRWKQNFGNQRFKKGKKNNATCPMCRQHIEIAESYVTRPLQWKIGCC